MHSLIWIYSVTFEKLKHKEDGRNFKGRPRNYINRKFRRGEKGLVKSKKSNP